MNVRLPKEIQDELDALEAAGVPHSIERGKRHIKIFIRQQLAGILPFRSNSSEHQRGTLNVRSQIRRAARGGGGFMKRFRDWLFTPRGAAVYFGATYFVLAIFFWMLR